jgi:hypothetical protein
MECDISEEVNEIAGFNERTHKGHLLFGVK